MGGSLSYGVVLLVVLGCFFVLCFALERQRRGIVVVLMVLGVAVLDAVVYSDTRASSVTSIFHPRLLGQHLRLVHVIIPVALLARLLAGHRQSRMGVASWLGLAFFAWVAVSAVSGLMQGHAAALVLRQATVIIQVGGSIALAAGVPARDYVYGKTVPRFVQASAVLATVLVSMEVLGVSISTRAIPMLPLFDFGQYAADAATLFSSIGVLGLVLSGVGSRTTGERMTLALPSVVLIGSHLWSPQRAARLGVVVSVTVVLLVLCTPTAWRRCKIGAGQVFTAMACLVALILGILLVTAVVQATEEPSTNQVSGPTRSVLEARTRQTSIESRYNQWAVSWSSIADSPILGNGLGHEQLHYDAGQREFRESDISHNIALDVLRRMGAVGLGFGVLALVVLGGQALGVWRGHPDDRVATLAIAAIAVATGLIAKGMVESIFEKHRLAVLLGIVLGVALAAARAGRHDEPARDDGALQEAAPRHELPAT